MSHLRAPAARADRREGGRHGRPVARTAATETHIRPHLMRLAVLPPTAVALGACAVVLFTVRATGVQVGPTLWAVLAGAAVVTGAGIGIAAVTAGRIARSVTDRLDALRRAAARGEADLRALVEALRRGDAPPQRRTRGLPPADADEFELLAADLARAHDGAVAAVVQATQLSSRTGSEQKLEVFLNLARRLQSLVHREILLLDELENEIEDPDLLKGLFHVDHLATRVRRHAENLAVLGGAVSRRQWSHPVAMTEVLRSAIAEVEQYSRVKLVPPVDGELRGHAVADVIHLLAELVENATVFSAPHTQVLLRANLVTSGLAVEVEDRGLGMPPEEQARMNALLADPDQVNVGRLLADGRIGLFVVSQLARRHGIRVRLQSNIYGGVQAILVVPQALLGGAGGPGVRGGVSGGAEPGGVPGGSGASGRSGAGNAGGVVGTAGVSGASGVGGGSAGSGTAGPASPAASGPAGVVPPPGERPPPGGTPPHGTGTPRRSAPRHASPRGASAVNGARAGARASGGATGGGGHRLDGTRPGGHAVDRSDELNGAQPVGEATLDGFAGVSADGYSTGGVPRVGGAGGSAAGLGDTGAGAAGGPRGVAGPASDAGAGGGAFARGFEEGAVDGVHVTAPVFSGGSASGGVDIGGASSGLAEAHGSAGVRAQRPPHADGTAAHGLSGPDTSGAAHPDGQSVTGPASGSAAYDGPPAPGTAPGRTSTSPSTAPTPAAGTRLDGTIPGATGATGPLASADAVHPADAAFGRPGGPRSGGPAPSGNVRSAASPHPGGEPLDTPAFPDATTSTGPAPATGPAHPLDPAYPTDPEHPAPRPAPLPMRNPRQERPNPAEARPGIRAGDRSAVEEVRGEVPVPRVGAVRGTMGKPKLPRRRAQEHLAPQLRGGPVPRPESEEPGGHDPGLMAAFQRGMGLAEAQLGLEADPDHSLTGIPVPPTRTHHPHPYDGSAPTG
ncbi:ATP-binding protein [Streptomyces sp. NPDC004539]|uniref:ATP-binding protein n=1 Tax=Streptomyces sp. NPDC004539 TaxID=3154280 RepID=UPI0033B24D4D